LQQILTQTAGFALLVMSQGGRVPVLDVPLALATQKLSSTAEGTSRIGGAPAGAPPLLPRDRGGRCDPAGDLIWLPSACGVHAMTRPERH
jgi:hypothetical protein